MSELNKALDKLRDKTQKLGLELDIRHIDTIRSGAGGLDGSKYDGVIIDEFVTKNK